MTGARRIAGHSVATGVSLLWQSLLAFILTYVLIRRLDVATYGAWVLLTVLLIQGRGLTSLLDLGLHQSIIYRLSEVRDRAERRRRLTAALRALATTGVAAGSLVVVLAPAAGRLFPTPNDAAAVTNALRLLGVQVAVDLVGYGLLAALEALRRYEVRKGLDAMRMTVFVGAVLVVVSTPEDLTRVAAASLGAAVLVATVAAVLVWKSGLRPVGGGSIWSELESGLPLIVLNASGVVYRQADKVILGALAGTVAASGYDVAEKITLVPMTLVGVTTAALVPAAAEGMNADPEATRRLVLSATRWTALLAGPLVGLCLGAARPLTLLLADEVIPGMVACVVYLGLTTLVIMTTAAAFQMAIGVGAGRSMAPVSIAGLIGNVVLTIALVPGWGLAGSAFATLVATSFEAVAMLAVTSRTFDHRSRRIVREAMPGIVAGGVVALTTFAATGNESDLAALVRGGTAGVGTLACLCAATWAFVRRSHPEALARYLRGQTIDERTAGD